MAENIEKDQRWGITENCDPAFELGIFDNLYKGNTIITKRLTEPLIEKLVEHKDKIILHFTVTGMGGTKIEPLVPTLEKSLVMFKTLIDKGFPVSHVVLRIDPIVPTEKGIKTAMKVLDGFQQFGITRVRISFLDMYDHVKERFKEACVPLPYDTFHANLLDRRAITNVLASRGIDDGYDLEVCGEPGIEDIPCLSMKDVKILGLQNEIKLEGKKDQRKSCSCPANKYQLLRGKPKQCFNKCLYCYLKN